MEIYFYKMQLGPKFSSGSLTVLIKSATSPFISPQTKVRNWARKQIGNFIEIYIKCPLEVCIKRDDKGNYKKALAGQINQFTGVSQPHQESDHPEIIVETNKENLEQSYQKVIKFLKKLNYLS